jgi:phosphopantothenoylcysteine decarboxylase/phosphopantothenate--cysteine ligase
MGVALAESARARGAEVVLIGANLAVEVPAGITRRDVVTAAELKRACEEEFPGCDVLLMAAAVADFAPAAPTSGKIKKGGRARLELVLDPTPDVLSALAGVRHDGQTIVGFAAEHGEGAVDYGRDKLRRKGLDAVVVNDIGRKDIGFEGVENEVTIVTAAGERHVPRTAKAAVAREVLETVRELRTEQRATA